MKMVHTTFYKQHIGRIFLLCLV